jgi:predicted short-subunit dehydrogenase-like oxidoreductase (DUF2520 family)
MSRRTDSFVLIGPGAAGRAVARAFSAAGGRAVAVVGRSRVSTRAAARELACPAIDLERIDRLAPAAIWVVAVPDRAIVPLARRLAAAKHPPAIAFHLSGALPASALAPLRRRGTAVAALHPLRAFASAPGEDLAGAVVAIQGDAEAARAAERWTRAAGGLPRRVRPSAKPLYHAAATLAAAGTATVLDVAIGLWKRCGFTEKEAREALGGLAHGAITLRQRASLRGALTGPVARGDVETIRAHLRSFRGLPDAGRLYRLLATIASDRSGRQKQPVLEGKRREPRPKEVSGGRRRRQTRRRLRRLER